MVPLAIVGILFLELMEGHCTQTVGVWEGFEKIGPCSRVSESLQQD